MLGRRALDDRGLGRVLLRLIAATAAAGGVSFGLAFAAGLLSFLSPCVLPLIPSYVGFLTGLSLEELRVRRGTALLHALWFVAGCSFSTSCGSGGWAASWSSGSASTCWACCGRLS